jgi:hypothetical protein
MKVTKLLYLLLIVIFAFAIGVAGCGDDDDDDSSGTTPDVDDDDDDVPDDDDDDPDDDDDDPDDDDDDSDTEYDSLICELPDPASLGEGITLGGGPITDNIDVYVYSGIDTDGDGICDALANATVLHAGATYTTDANGYTAVPVGAVKSTELVTAFFMDYWTWSYQADAAVMYFRLQPDEHNKTYTDSPDGDFTQGGAALGLTNPSTVAGLFLNPISGGFSVPGVSRESLIYTDFVQGLFTDTFFQVDLNGYPRDIWTNVYVPAFDYTVPGLITISADHEMYKVPMYDSGTEFPIEGFVASLDIGSVVPSIPEIITIIDCIDTAADLTETLACIDTLVEPLFNDGFDFSYAGAVPDWDGVGTPDIPVVETDQETTVVVSNPDAGFDYVSFLTAEIPNRALLPLGLGFANALGEAPLDYAEVDDANYMAVVAKTDFLTSNLTSQNFSFALKFADDMTDWNTSIEFTDADFLPNFDASTNYDSSTGTITWSLESQATVDAYYVAVTPACFACDIVIAVVPGTVTSYTIPATELGLTLSDSDTVFVFGADLPGDVNIDSFSPTDILAYNISAITLWTNHDMAATIAALLADLMS